MPRNKSNLLQRLQTREIVFDRRPSYVGVTEIHYGHREQYPWKHGLMEQARNCVAPFIRKWSRYNWSRLLSYSYFVYRRSALDPLFHPYFINYGSNKVEMYYRLRALKCSHFISQLRIDNTPFILSHDFGFDIPHAVTRVSSQYYRSIKKHPMTLQHLAFLELCKDWM